VEFRPKNIFLDRSHDLGSSRTIFGHSKNFDQKYKILDFFGQNFRNVQNGPKLDSGSCNRCRCQYEYRAGITAVFRAGITLMTFM
jgi:hypothetical protein